jgi:ubiquinol-cytochrome c reductase iron-sulfur subunit
MTVDEMDKDRRKFLTASTAVIGGVGAALASVPFIDSWSPSAKARALGAPVDVDISKIEPGQKITVTWRGQPVFIVHRTDENLAELDNVKSKLRDPDSIDSIQPTYAQNIYRSINKNYLVLIGLCTHLGCVPIFKPNAGSIEPSWLGGFFCPCHGSKYDLAGRVYSGVPAPTNLPVPPYLFVNEQVIRIGESSIEGAI